MWGAIKVGLTTYIVMIVASYVVAIIGASFLTILYLSLSESEGKRAKKL